MIFPTLSHLCEAGVVTENEARIIQSVDDKCIGNENETVMRLMLKSSFIVHIWIDKFSCRSPKILDVPGVGWSGGDQSKEGGKDQG